MLGKLDLVGDSVRRTDPTCRGRRGACWGSWAVLVWVVAKGHLPYLWREWITSVDHKRIGVMYCAARLSDAAARRQRRHHDAHPAGGRLPFARAI